MATPILTIAIPTYERPTLLARALASVVDHLGSQADRIELIVSDNSPAVSREIVEGFLARWSGPSRYLPNEPSIGAIGNFNQCIAEAKGRFFLLLHDDDYLLPAAADALLPAIDAAGDDRVLLFGVDVVDERGRRRRRQGFRAEARLSPSRALRRLLTDSSFVRIPSIVVRRDVFDEVGVFDASVGNPADFDLLVRIFARLWVRCEPVTIAAYSVHVDTLTTDMFHAGSVAAVMAIFERATALGVLDAATIRRGEADWFHQWILGGTYRHLRGGDPVEARVTFGLFDLPAVAGLGPSTRWRPVRWLFWAIVRLPPGLAARLMRIIGRASPERFWPSW